MITSLNHPIWHDVIVEIRRLPEQRRYCQKVLRGLNGSTNHIREIVRLLAHCDLVEIIPTTKIKKIRITESGKKVADLILEMRAELRKCQ